MANLRGNSLVGGKPIVSLDMLNRFVEDIQASQRDEMMHKFEKEILSTNQVIDAYIKDKSKNGVWLCSGVQDFSIYNYGTLLNFSTGNSRLQLYAPHKKSTSDKYHDCSGLFFRTGWNEDIKDWQEVASVDYVKDKNNEIKEEINNTLKTEQYLSYEGVSIKAINTIEGRTEDIKIKGKTLQNLVSSTPAKNAANVQIEKLLESNLFKVGSTYTINIPNRNNRQLIVVVKTKEGVTKNINLSSTTNTFTVEEDYPIVFRLTLHTTNGWNVEQDLTNADNAVVLEGNNVFVKQHFEGIKSFGEENREGNKYKISFSSTGKNLAKIDLKNPNITLFEDGFKLDCRQLYLLKEDIFNMKGKYKENTQYILSYEGKLLDNSNNNNYRLRIWYTDGTFTDGTVHSNSYTKRIIQSLNGKTIDNISGYYGAINGDFVIKNLMLQEGTEDSQYEDYKNDTKSILIKEPLRSIKNISDIICQENEQIKIYRNTYKYRFTGNEPWQYGGESSQKNVCLYLPKSSLSSIIPNCNFDIGFTEDKNVICNKLMVISRANLSDVNILQKNNCISINFNGINLNINSLDSYDGSSKDVAKAKEWLKNNPIEIIYQLSTPIIEIIENCKDLNLATFKDKTYIETYDNIKGNLELKIPSNIYSMINNNSKNINNLYSKLQNSFYIKTILLNEWQEINHAFKYRINHNLGTKLIANIAATKEDGMSTNIDYKIIDENNIEIYTIDRNQLDIIIKTI